MKMCIRDRDTPGKAFSVFRMLAKHGISAVSYTHLIEYPDEDLEDITTDEIRNVAQHFLYRQS